MNKSKILEKDIIYFINNELDKIQDFEGLKDYLHTEEGMGDISFQEKLSNKIEDLLPQILKEKKLKKSTLSNINPRLYFSKEEISNRVYELALKISEDYNSSIHTVCVLKGAAPFHSDLVRAISLYTNYQVYSDYIFAESYLGTESTGTVRCDLKLDAKGKDILVVEDILDTGRTLYEIKNRFMETKANSVKLCTLFDKEKKKAKEIKADYTGFKIKDEFIVGYGLDFNQKYRQLPDVYILK